MVQSKLMADGIQHNLGARSLPRIGPASYPDAGPLLRSASHGRKHHVDVLLVNPPSADGAIWIRSQHRVGRRSRENMIWPQVSLAQLAAMIHPRFSVEIVDAIATRMAWRQFERLLRERSPRFYVTQVAAPTLTNDMYGVFLAKSLGAVTIAFGTHVTPMPQETMERFPCLDFVIRGEPEYTFKELIETIGDKSGNGSKPVVYRNYSGDHCHSERREGSQPTKAETLRLCSATAQNDSHHFGRDRLPDLSKILGLVWRRGDEVVVNPDRPFIPNLDDLPVPLHHLLPLDRYRVPMIRGPYTFIVTSRGCTGGCRFCIKHVSYQNTVRLRSPENIQKELWQLHGLGVHNVNMYADLFTVNREQVVGLCDLLIREGPRVHWTCNSRVDYVDPEMLWLMGKAGCWMISWGIESGSNDILRRTHKGIDLEKVERALSWAKAAGIKNWGFFIIGLPGETEETIRQTIDFAKRLPLDLALFHIAAPYPGTPFFFEVVENGWFRPGTQWEEVDMDCSTVLDYPNLKAEDLERWQKRAFREWALRPGPILTYLKMLTNPGTLTSTVEVGLRHLTWVTRWQRVE